MQGGFEQLIHLGVDRHAAVGVLSPGRGSAPGRARQRCTRALLRTQSEVARSYGVSKGWVSKLLARYRNEGEAAFQPRSRRPSTSPKATPPAVIDLVGGGLCQAIPEGVLGPPVVRAMGVG